MGPDFGNDSDCTILGFLASDQKAFPLIKFCVAEKDKQSQEHVREIENGREELAQR